MSKKIQKGVLLVAEPSIISDLSFNRAVVLLTDHNPNGTVGFILNKPLEYTINDLLPEVYGSFKIYNGGPVEQDNLYFIHTLPELIPQSIEISNGLFWGGNFDVIKNLINEGKIHKEAIRFFLGYTGWKPDQLEEEIKDNSWIVSKNTHKEKVLSVPSLDFWREKIMEFGGENIIWLNAPENPIFN